MVKTINCLKTLIGCFLILFQVSNSCCEDLSPSLVEIFWNFKSLCAGTLVNDKYVVTSGRCFTKNPTASSLTVTGSYQTNTDEVISVEEIILHEDFNYYAKNRVWEVTAAVLKLKTPFSNRNIKSAQLCNLKELVIDEPAIIYSFDHSKCRDPVIEYNVTISGDTPSCDLRYDFNFKDDIYCGTDEWESYDPFYGGGPVDIQGQFCGIYHPNTDPINDLNPGIFTFIGNNRILKFIKESTSYSKC